MAEADRPDRPDRPDRADRAIGAPGLDPPTPIALSLHVDRPADGQVS